MSKKKIPRRTDNELIEIVKKLRANIYINLDTREKLQFQPCLVMGDFSDIDLDSVGAILGDMTKAIGTRTINGIPCFGGLLLIQKDDWKIIVDTYKSSQEIKLVKGDVGGKKCLKS